MEIMRWIGIALCGVVASAILRSFGRKDAALMCEIACGILLLAMIFTKASAVMESLPLLASKADVDDELLALLLRVTGIAVAAELSAQLCRDAGIGALAQKIELGGKVVILCASLPMMIALCDCMLSLLQ